ncbi:MAG: hypothetical protein RLZZ499_197 [Cyanobacteriota bacterium]
MVYFFYFNTSPIFCLSFVTKRVRLPWCRVKDEKILDLDEILDESKKPEQGEQFVKEQAVSVIGW